ELADGPRFFYRTLKPILEPGAFLRIVLGNTVPVLQKGKHLVIIEILQGRVGEAGVTQPLRLIADDARGDDDGRQRIARGKCGNLLNYGAAGGRVEDFVEP